MTVRDRRGKQLRLVIVILMMALMVVTCRLPFAIRPNSEFLAPAVESTVETILTEKQRQMADELATQFNNQEPTATQPPDPTATPTLRIVGSEYRFDIHRVRKGENLSQYASEYKTSEAAIIRVNYSISLPLWEDTLVVIPVGFTHVAQMPYFQPFVVTEEGMKLEDLARELDTNLESLKYYNGIIDDRLLRADEWLIIPRMSPGY